MKKLKIYTWKIYKYSHLFNNTYDYIRVIAKSKKKARKLLKKKIKECYIPNTNIILKHLNAIKKSPKVQVVKNKFIINSDIDINL